jgi:hypothetical protein
MPSKAGRLGGRVGEAEPDHLKATVAILRLRRPGRDRGRHLDRRLGGAQRLHQLGPDVTRECR